MFLALELGIRGRLPVGVLERVDGLFEAEHARTDVDDHDRAAVAAQTVLQHARELRVSIINEGSLE